MPTPWPNGIPTPASYMGMLVIIDAVGLALLYSENIISPKGGIENRNC
jgi:hypothetical protein